MRAAALLIPWAGRTALPNGRSFRSPTGSNGSKAPVRSAVGNGCNPFMAVGQSASVSDK
jgi:hypothetical protein